MQFWNRHKKFHEFLRSSQSDPEVSPKGDEGEACLCVCEALSPALRFSQLFGVMPVTLNNSPYDDSGVGDWIPPCQKFQKILRAGGENHIRKEKKCCISTKWKSFPFFMNLLLLTCFISVTTWLYFHIHFMLHFYFEGTDLYTFGTQTICFYTQCNLILINALLRREKVCQIWVLLIKVLKNLLNEPTNPVYQNTAVGVAGAPAQVKTQIDIDVAVAAAAIRRNMGQFEKPPINSKYETLKILDFFKSNNDRPGGNARLRKRLVYLRLFAFGTVTMAVILSICHTISFINLVFRACFNDSGDDSSSTEMRLPCPFNNFFLFMQKFCFGFIDFVQQGAAVFFGTICLLIFIFFREIEDQLASILKDSCNLKSTGVGVQSQYLVENLRITYENLSHCCRLMSQCFGVAVLAVLISSVVSITCALYSFALYSGAIEKQETARMARYYVIWAFHGWLGCFCMTMILLPGQMITNASEAPCQVIGRCALTNIDEGTKFQLSQFQHQAKRRVVITACNVTNIGLGFISAAATNVTTYILVILQFRLGVEK